MANIYGFTSPTAGREMIAGLLAGETLTITKVMVGTGKPENLDQMAALTNLISPMAYATSTTPVHSGSTVTMTIEYRSDLNGSLAAGFHLNEYGVFAKTETSEETLIYYGSLGDYPQWVNAYSPGQPPDIRRFPVTIVVADEVNVNVQYTADAFITAEEAEALLKSMVDGVVGASDVVGITIPASAWVPGGTGLYHYQADVACALALATHFPVASLHDDALSTAAAAGVAPIMRTYAGSARFYAQAIPSDDMNATLALISGSEEHPGDGRGIVNMGNTMRVNVPGGVAGLDEDGKVLPSVLPDDMTGGFIQYTGQFPASPKPNTLYGEILADYT